MEPFDETSEFPATAAVLAQLRQEAEATGWRVAPGTVFEKANGVSPLLHQNGHVLGCRFEKEGEVVALHVYCHPDDPLAILTVPRPRSSTVEQLLSRVRRASNTPISVL